MPSDTPLNKRRTHYDLDRHFELFLEATSLDAMTTKKHSCTRRKSSIRRCQSVDAPYKHTNRGTDNHNYTLQTSLLAFFLESRNMPHVLDNERTVWKYTCDRRLFVVHAPQLKPHPRPTLCLSKLSELVWITETLQTLRRAWNGLTWLRTVCGREQFRVSSRHNSGTSDITGPSYSCFTSRRDTPAVLSCGHL